MPTDEMDGEGGQAVVVSALASPSKKNAVQEAQETIW